MIFPLCKWYFDINWHEFEKRWADVFQIYPNANPSQSSPVLTIHAPSSAFVFPFPSPREFSRFTPQPVRWLNCLISAPPRTQHEQKPLGLFWQFRPSTSNYNDTLYYYLVQDLSIRRKTRDRAERQFTQLPLSDGGQKKPAGKNPVGKKFGRKSG